MSVPAAPVISARSNGPSVIRIRWQLVVGATSYKVYRDTSANPTSLLKTVTDVTAYDATVTPGTTYHYRVKAHNGDGDSGYSNDVKVHAEATVTSDTPTEALRINARIIGQS